MDKIDFTDKVAIITGASSGVGVATAVAFASYGAKLTLVGTSEARLLHTAQQCVSKNRLVPLWLALDLTQQGSCETVINKTIEMYGKIDILVNSASKVVRSTVFDTSMNAFDKAMNINFRVPYQLSQLALPHLVHTKGNIINIGSSMSKRFRPGYLPYIVAKSALETFTKHAAPELVSQGVRINTISPRLTKRDVVENFIEDHTWLQTYGDQPAGDMPSGQELEPEEVATLICLTASNIFPNLNGSEFLLDGGSSMA